MNKAFCVVALAVLVGVGSVTRAEAIPVVSLEGIPANWNIGDSFAVDVVITGLDQATGGVNAEKRRSRSLPLNGYQRGRKLR